MLEQVIKVGDRLLCTGLKELPASSLTAQVLNQLGRQLAASPQPNEAVL